MPLRRLAQQAVLRWDASHQQLRWNAGELTTAHSGLRSNRVDAGATDKSPNLQPLDEHVDHVRGSVGVPVVEYGDYECPYSRLAFRAIEQVKREFPRGVCFAFRHFPLIGLH